MTWHVEALELISTTRHQVWRPWAFFPHPVKATTTCLGGMESWSWRCWRLFFGDFHPLFDLEIVYVMEIGKGFQTHCRNGNENYVYILKTEIWSLGALGWSGQTLSPWQGWKSASQATKGQSMYGGLRNLQRFLQRPDLQFTYIYPAHLPMDCHFLR